MNWKLKALIQNGVALLPSKLSYSVYYLIQRRLGGLAAADPTDTLCGGVRLLERINKQGRTAHGKSFLEIGTGRRLNLPISLWLCGAEKIFTIDVNPYLTAELVWEDLEYIRKNESRIVALFGDHSRHPLFIRRFKELLSWTSNDLNGFLTLINTAYVVQKDSDELSLPSRIIDFHVSRSVLEHIPPTVMAGILKESKRLLRPDGLLVHSINLTDHFSHSDNSISSVNFLKFSERVWGLIAGNRFMYQNRLRIDDFLGLFSAAGLKVLLHETEIDRKALMALEGGLKIDKRFRDKTISVNATATAWILAEVPVSGL